MPTLLHRLHQWAESNPSAQAQAKLVGTSWKIYTAKDLRDSIFYLACFFKKQGFDSEQTSIIYSYNSPEWAQAEYGTHLSGMKSAGLYPNSSVDDIHYVLNHTSASILFVQNRDYFERILGPNKDRTLPDTIKTIIVFDGDTSIHPEAISFLKALELGKAFSKSESLKPEQMFEKVDPKRGAFLIYTSGTTGKPKGALLSHDNFVFTADQLFKQVPLPYARGSMFSFLPLCHVAEKIQSMGVGITGRYLIYYCSAFDQLAEELKSAEPTLFLAVPRLWEKMMEGVQGKIRASSPLKKQMVEWAFRVSENNHTKKLQGQTVSLREELEGHLANRLVISKVKMAIGLGKMEICASGAAALPAHVTKWFRKLGFEIEQDFGQTETTGVIAFTEVGKDCAGTVGRPLGGTEVRIAEDGEVCVKGRNVFLGYFKDDRATQETIRDGWLHTGDLGKINENGYLVIQGRKKEIIKTSGGKMIAPAPIEERIKELSWVSQACLVGDGKKYVTALLTLSEEGLKKISSDQRKKQVLDSGEVLSKVEEKIEAVNSSLAGFERVKYFTVLVNDFSLEKGEMTPTLKIKRNVVEANYRDLIDQMYRS